jgi:sugar O-acyltransferase (sialic acid O-acetyltransferase NeuD family)
MEKPFDDGPLGRGMRSPTKTGKLIIVGDSAFAEIAYEYFTHDSPYEVVAFAVERAFLKRDRLMGLPVVAFEDLQKSHAPAEHSVYCANVYTQLNRLRTRLMTAAKEKGFSLASYVSSAAFVWRNVEIGEHCFIFENNVVQPFVKIGSNVVLWSGNHIGHHSVIRDNVFIASHAVISGFVEIGANSFVGVNATFANNIKVGKDSLIGAGATVLKDTKDGQLYGATMTKPHETRTALEYFKVDPTQA